MLAADQPSAVSPEPTRRALAPGRARPFGNLGLPQAVGRIGYAARGGIFDAVASARAAAGGVRHVSGEAERVVLVDDRPERRRILREIFVAAGVGADDIGEADDLNSAAQIVQTMGFGAVVLERPRAISDGLEAIAQMRSRFPQLRIVVCSFDNDDASERLEREAGVDFHLDKPLRTSDVRHVVDGRGRAAPAGASTPLMSCDATGSR
jgi:CheY-like chemotaxis protein